MAPGPARPPQPSAYQWFQVGTAAIITSSATASNVENTVLAHALTADQSVTWSLVAGGDWGSSRSSGSTLRWDVNVTRDFENPNDSNSDNAYIVTVRATNTTGQRTDQTITVTVTNVVDATLAFDFTANTSVIDAVASTAVAPLTVTRAGTVFFAETVAGTWTGLRRQPAAPHR